MSSPLRKYRAHRYHAQTRGIGFEFTFDEWMRFWLDSGHWEERGIRKGQYVMARFNDEGAYTIDNVEIITGEQNRAQPQVRVKLSVSNTGKFPTQATRRKLSASRVGNQNAKGKHWTLSAETRAKQSISQLGNQKCLGKVWITNGIQDQLIDRPVRLKRGWTWGRCRIRGSLNGRSLN
jgi:hypothetical protein